MSVVALLLASSFLHVSLYGPVWAYLASSLPFIILPSANANLDTPTLVRHATLEKYHLRPLRTVASTHALVRVPVRSLQPVTVLTHLQRQHNGCPKKKQKRTMQDSTIR